MKPFRHLARALAALCLSTSLAWAQGGPLRDDPRMLQPPPKPRSQAAPKPVAPAKAEPERYRACLDLADSAPDQAYDQASLWIDESPTVPARHCQAMALMRMGQYEKAGVALLDLAESLRQAPKAVRGEMLVQAGEVNLLAKRPVNALKALDEAWRLLPEDPLIAAHRGRAQIMAENWKAAVDALSDAIALDPTSAEAWTLRASARRRQGDLKRADEDVETALALDDNRAMTWLERGLLDQAKGDKPAARRHLVQAIQINDKSPVADEARRAIEVMDVKTTR